MNATNTRRLVTGFSLIEVMIALALGVFMLTFGMQALIAINKSFVLIKQKAKMQETARFAHQLIQQDINRSKYWRAILEYSEFSGTLTLSSMANEDCIESDSSWGRRLQQPIFALNNTATNYDCVSNDQYLGGDILTLRFPDLTPVSSYDNQQLYLRTNNAEHRLFFGADKSDFENTNLTIATNTQLINSHSYFIADTNRRCKGAIIPSLYWQTLVNAKPQKEELLSGIEHLQLQFLVDEDGDEQPDKYVNPNQVANWHSVFAVNVYLLLRSECPDLSFTDTKTYQLADMQIKPNDNFHRQLYQFSFNYR